MGLDTTHNCWHGAYSRFNQFREWLAEQIGIKLLEMEGFGGNKSFDEVNHKIRPLLDHSDCDGELTVEECKLVAEGLNEIIKSKGDYSMEEKYFIERAEQFRDGCLDAIRNDEPVKFH